MEGTVENIVEESEGEEEVKEESVEDEWIITIDDPSAEDLDFNQSRIHKLQNLESLSQIQVTFLLLSVLLIKLLEAVGAHCYIYCYIQYRCACVCLCMYAHAKFQMYCIYVLYILYMATFSVILDIGQLLYNTTLLFDVYVVRVFPEVLLLLSVFIILDLGVQAEFD